MKRLAFLITIIGLIIMKIFFPESLLTKKLNIGSITTKVVENKDNAVAVNKSYISVLDYYEKDNQLIIKYSNNKVKLPYNGLVSNTIDYIELEATDGSIKIYGLESCNYRLYQYYSSNLYLGNAKKITITGDYKEIISCLRIENAQV